MSILTDLKRRVTCRFSSYQKRAGAWIFGCFGPTLLYDTKERCDRFLEESLELVQSLGYTASEAHQMVEHVFAKTVGDPRQEVGGVMHTLSGLCTSQGIDLIDAAETEYARVVPLMDKVRSKHETKPIFYPIVNVRPDGEVLLALNHLQTVIDDFNDAICNNRSVVHHRNMKQSLELAMRSVQCAHRNGLIHDRSVHHATTSCNRSTHSDAVAAHH